jgi:hypothetical protein
MEPQGIKTFGWEKSACQVMRKSSFLAGFSFLACASFCVLGPPNDEISFNSSEFQIII